MRASDRRAPARIVPLAESKNTLFVPARKGFGAALLSAALLSATAFCAADTITVNGITYRDVYVRAEKDAYYVRFPADGTTLEVPKQAVAKEDLLITPDDDQRSALLEKWKQNNAKKRRQKPKRETIVIENPKKKTAKPDDFDAFERGEGGPLFTNQGEKYRAKSVRGPVFISRKGVPLFTNRPKEYRGQREYVEVTLHFDPVFVPGQYKGFTPAQYTSEQIAEIVRDCAARYGLDPDLVLAVVRVESNFRPYAVSRAGARGLMQLMPGTAAEMGLTEATVFDPAHNIAAGTQYLAKMLDLFDGNLPHALAAYNAGPGNVKKYGGVPPFNETRNYVRNVQRFYRRFSREGLAWRYAAGEREVGGGYLPDAEGAYCLIELTNGLTERAEEVIEGTEYYYARFGDRIAQIPKDKVKRIIKPQ